MIVREVFMSKNKPSGDTQNRSNSGVSQDANRKQGDVNKHPDFARKQKPVKSSEQALANKENTNRNFRKPV